MVEPDPDHRISSWIAFDLLGKAITVLENENKLSEENKMFKNSN
jgi:hypothetical protein